MIISPPDALLSRWISSLSPDSHTLCLFFLTYIICLYVEEGRTVDYEWMSVELLCLTLLYLAILQVVFVLLLDFDNCLHLVVWKINFISLYCLWASHFHIFHLNNSSMSISFFGWVTTIPESWHCPRATLWPFFIDIINILISLWWHDSIL